MTNQNRNERGVEIMVESAGERQVMLSGPQQTALEWLMNGGSVNEAAELAGVCRQTVSKWLHNDSDFQSVYDAWRMQIGTVASGRIAALADTAVETIAAAIRERRDVKAAQFVLKQVVGGKGALRLAGESAR